MPVANVPIQDVVNLRHALGSAAVCALVVATAACGGAGGTVSTGGQTCAVDISFNRGASRAQIDAVRQRAEALAQVTRVVFRSREQVMAAFVDQLRLGGSAGKRGGSAELLARVRREAGPVLVATVEDRDAMWAVDRALRGLSRQVALGWGCPASSASLLVSSGGRRAAIGGYGVWTLERLGYFDQVIRRLGEPLDYHYWRAAGGRSVSVAFPPGAAQGKRGYYLLRLHYRLVFGTDSGDGLVELAGHANGGASALITFDVKGAGSELEVTRHGLGLVDGSFRDTARRRVWEGTYVNFIQNKGVRPGPGALWFSVAARGGAKVEEFRVFADSGIVYQRGGLADVRLVPSLRDRQIKVGEPFRVHYQLRNVGGTAVPAGGAIWVTDLAEGLCVFGADTNALARIPPHGAASGSFVLRAERPGRLRFALKASTFGGSPIARLAANVTGSERAAPSMCPP